MKIELDTHTHTIVSGHAYSTLNEMAKAASDAGLKLIANTDHAPAMPGGAHIYHFQNLRILPDYIEGVRVLKGAEANIIDFNGNIDMPIETQEEMEIIIASFHGPCIKPSSVKETTESLLKLLDNKNINILGHPEDRRYAFDYKTVISKAKECNTLIELNNSSLLPTTFRENSREGLIKILEVCGDLDAMIVLGSDSHHTSSVGRFDKALELIKEVGFPENLVINTSTEKFLNFIRLIK